MEEPTLTQPSARQQNILVNAEGSPLKVNLQAVELEGRPKLVRFLKGSGAIVVSNAKEAAIILVDSATESGKRLIRTWGHDASKVVLEHTWVRASTNVGRPLLEADNWGGALTIDDGKPLTIDGVVVDEDELEEVEALVAKSPLPTPRITPVDPMPQRPEITAESVDVTRLASGASAPTPSAAGLLPPGHLAAQPTIVNPTPSEQTRVPMNPDPRSDVLPQQSLPSLPTTQPSSYLQPIMSVQSPQSHSAFTLAPFNSQPSYHSQPQMIPTQSFSSVGFLPSSSQPPTQPSLHPPLPSSQIQMTQPAPNIDAISGANPQNPNLATIMTIMEVVRHMDQSSWFGQNQLPQISQPPTNSQISSFPMRPPITPGSIPSTFQSTRKDESPVVDASMQGSQDYLSDTTGSSRRQSSSRKVSEGLSTVRESRVKSVRSSSDVTSTPASRKRPSAIIPDNPPKRPRKGKQRATVMYSSEDSEADAPTAVSDGSYLTNSPYSSSKRSLNVVAHKKRGEIFLSESGGPLRFFVQVDLHGRHAVVTNIKKNMGKIVNNIADSDYLILSPRSDTFQGLLHEATALGKFPILAAFVADCVEEDALLDETDYIMDSGTRVKPVKRGRQNVFSMQGETSGRSTPQTKRAKPQSPATLGESKKTKETPSKALTRDQSKKKLTPSKPTSRAQAESRSPTPPPASNRQEMGSGRFLFTHEEDEYILVLAKHHLNRDPTISNSALVHKLHAKMPHHTVGSWGVHIDKFKGAVEDVRKRANIAKRKRDSEAATQNSAEALISEGAALNERNLSREGTNGDVSMRSSQTSQEDLERQDFDIITRFFASGGGDDDNDERVWQELEKHRPCRSFKSWPEYYAAHQQEVYVRIEELMNTQTGS